MIPGPFFRIDFNSIFDGYFFFLSETSFMAMDGCLSSNNDYISIFFNFWIIVIIVIEMNGTGGVGGGRGEGRKWDKAWKESGRRKLEEDVVVVDDAVSDVVAWLSTRRWSHIHGKEAASDAHVAKFQVESQIKEERNKEKKKKKK